MVIEKPFQCSNPNESTSSSFLRLHFLPSKMIDITIPRHRPFSSLLSLFLSPPSPSTPQKNKQKILQEYFYLVFCWESKRMIFLKPFFFISPSFLHLSLSLPTTCLWILVLSSSLGLLDWVPLKPNSVLHCPRRHNPRLLYATHGHVILLDKGKWLEHRPVATECWITVGSIHIGHSQVLKNRKLL